MEYSSENKLWPHLKEISPVSQGFILDIITQYLIQYEGKHVIVFENGVMQIYWLSKHYILCCIWN